MTLQDKYLSHYHFNEIHSIRIRASRERVSSCMEALDFRGSAIIRFLFLLRGMPSRMMNLEGINKEKFLVLEKKPNEEIAIGLIGQFWKINGNLQHFLPEEFRGYNTPGFCKAVWNFRLTTLNENHMLLETETRVLCLDEATRKRFSRYWFFIKPFSGIIRKEILKAIRKQAEG